MLREKRLLGNILGKNRERQQHRNRQQQAGRARKLADKGHRFHFLWELPRDSLYRIAAAQEALPDGWARSAVIASAARSAAPGGPSLLPTSATSARMGATSGGS